MLEVRLYRHHFLFYKHFVRSFSIHNNYFHLQLTRVEPDRTAEVLQFLNELLLEQFPLKYYRIKYPKERLKSLIDVNIDIKRVPFGIAFQQVTRYFERFVLKVDQSIEGVVL